MPGVPNQFEQARGVAHGSWVFYLPDLTGGTGDLLTNFVPGFAGRIVNTYLIVVTTVTSAGTADVDFNLEVGAVNMGGGVVNIATNAAAGAYVAGTAITGSNNFDRDDTISLELVETVAPTGGAVNFVVEYETKVIS